MNVPSVEVHEIPDGAVLLDVREDDEWTAGHIDGAVHVPMMSVPNKLAYEPDVISPDRPVVVLCAHGGRSAQVTHFLNRNGYQAVNLLGGMHAWHDAGRPMVSETDEEPYVL